MRPQPMSDTTPDANAWIGHGDEAVGFRHMSPRSTRSPGSPKLRGLARVLPQGEHDLLRERHAPDRRGAPSAPSSPAGGRRAGNRCGFSCGAQWKGCARFIHFSRSFSFGSSGVPGWIIAAGALLRGRTSSRRARARVLHVRLLVVVVGEDAPVQVDALVTGRAAVADSIHGSSPRRLVGGRLRGGRGRRTAGAATRDPPRPYCLSRAPSPRTGARRREPSRHAPAGRDAGRRYPGLKKPRARARPSSTRARSSASVLPASTYAGAPRPCAVRRERDTRLQVGDLRLVLRLDAPGASPRTPRRPPALRGRGRAATPRCRRADAGAATRRSGRRPGARWTARRGGARGGSRRPACR